MHLLDPTYIRDNVDYSFGDESGHGLFNGYMKPCNLSNTEFVNKYKTHDRPYMTLFCDNIRLYRREGIRYTANEEVKPEWKSIKNMKVKRLANEDLLALCKALPDMDFIIFCHFEDTPIDEFIHDLIPDNVKAIYASNCMSYGGKVHPMPYGLQRKLSPTDKRHEILMSMLATEVVPEKWLYVNYNSDNNPIRPRINRYLKHKSWATIKQPPIDYKQYLKDIQEHAFVLCPSGNAEGCECHRDWETLYMHRVPVVERSDYLEYIFNGFPVLFVDSLLTLKQSDLVSNMHLLEEAKKIDLNELDMKRIYDNIIDKETACYQHI